MTKNLTRRSRNQISFSARDHERNEKHERRNHHSFNGKPKATVSIGLLYFEGAEPRINVNFRELIFSHGICSSFLYVAASLREFSFFQKAGRVPLPLFGSVSTKESRNDFHQPSHWMHLGVCRLFRFLFLWVGGRFVGIGGGTRIAALRHYRLNNRPGVGIAEVSNRIAPQTISG